MKATLLLVIDNLRGRPEPQDTLGWIYLKLNRPVDARAAFRASHDRSAARRAVRQALRRGETAPGGEVVGR